MRTGLRVFIIGGFVLLLDQLSKTWVLNNIEIYEDLAIIPSLYPYFRFFVTTNTGVAFGLFRDANLIFIGVSAIASLAILVYSFKQSDTSWILSIALGLMIGGATGNLVDRIRYGSVVDFIHFQYSDSLAFPTFNIADSSIVVGTIILVLYLFWQERQENRQQQSLVDQT